MMRPLEQVFQQGAACVPGTGEAICTWQGGQETQHLAFGEARPGAPWGVDTLAPVFSATKPFSAACLLLALHERQLTPELEIGELWPRFPAPRCTVAHLLSHQVGLPALAMPASMFALDECRAAIEATTPAWEPPCHGYHPHTYGPMVDILMRELTGVSIAAYWEERVRRPLGLPFYIGLPEPEFHRVAALRAPRLHGAMPRSAFYDRYFDPQSLVYRAFHSVTGLAGVREMNTPRAWQCGCPARGGVASARGLAMAYQALMGVLPGSPFPREILKWMSRPRSKGMDLIMNVHNAFTCGAMCSPEPLFGRGGFGHPGAGGFFAFAEPASGRSFAYVMNQMQLGILPGERVQQLVNAWARADS